MTMNRRRVLGAALGSAAWLGAASVRGQSAGAKVMTLLVPYPPGASTDQVARLVAQRWSAITGQTLVIENRGGANGNVGAAVVAKSPPDGSRILLATQPIVSINPFIYKDAGFDANKDLTPLTCGVNAVVALVAHPSLPANTVAELIDYGKRNPGALQYGTAGSGSPQHIGGLLLAQRAGIGLTHVPYRGGGPMVTDLVAGHIKLGIVSLSAVKAHVADKRLKVLAIGEKTRFAGAPDIPTVAETLPGFSGELWVGLFVGAGTPEAIVRKLAQEVEAVVAAPDVQEKFAALGVEKLNGGPDTLARMLRTDLAAWKPIVQASGASVD